MFPVGDEDLKNMLFRLDNEIVALKDIPKHDRDRLRSISRDDRKQQLHWLASWFKCLSSALAYMHKEGIRHQDIKPSNIIHRGPVVYFTDFSSSCQFEAGQTSTEGPAATSRMYRAPEVANQVFQDSNDHYSVRKHGRGTDVFGLGCMFVEMFIVMKKMSLCGFHSRCIGGYGYGKPLKDVDSWFEHGLPDNCKELFSTIRPLLATARKDRPPASDLPARFDGLRHHTLGRCLCAEPSSPVSRNLIKNVTLPRHPDIEKRASKET